MSGVVKHFSHMVVQIHVWLWYWLGSNFNCVIQKFIVDPQGRFIILKAGIQDKAYILVNIYAPNKDKVSGKLYKNLHRVLQTKDLDCEENIIIGVDFKCPLDPKLDKKGGVNIGS